MTKRFICIILILLCPASFFIGTAWADSTALFSELGNCKYIYTYSGRNNAYFYGYTNTTLYSARAVPTANLRYVNTDGCIRAVCHDESNAYALFDGNNCYKIVRMNMDSGACDYVTITGSESISNRSFAVSESEIFILQKSNSYPYVKSYNFSGKALYSYTFSKGVDRLFCNGSNAYARSVSGEIFRLSGGSKTKCADLEAYTDFSDAGCGYILTSDGRLISLGSGDVEYPRCDNAVRTSQNSFKLCGNTLSFTGGDVSVSSAKLMCAAGQTAAVLGTDNRCTTFNASQIKSNPQASQSGSKSSNLKISDGVAVGIDAEITVTQAKEKFPEIAELYDFDGNKITSGKLKTGYYALIGGTKYPVAIRGDVNGTGTLNRSDLVDLMDAIIEKITLSPCRSKAADFNLDGKINTQDLVLLGLRIKGEI